MTAHFSDTRKIDPTRGETLADGWPNDDDLIREHGGGNKRIAIDKIMTHGKDLHRQKHRLDQRDALCDEWPSMPHPDRCAESLVSPEGSDFSIKQEDQTLITDTGYENLTTYPFEGRLMGN